MLLLVLACALPPAPEPPHLPEPDPIVRFECDRCHGAEPLFAAAPEERSCVGCHRAILAGRYDDELLPERVAGWKAHLRHLNEVPSLVGLSDRVTRSWFVEFVQRPVDLRPHLPASMPRLPLGPADAEALADRFGLTDGDPSVPDGDVDAGRALIRDRCTPCHTTAPLAPDLSWIRHRSTPDRVDRWLAGPSLVKPDTPMPDPGLDDAARADVVAALFAGTPTPSLPPIPPADPVPDRPVTYAEVDRLVFHASCRHCHADPAPVEGDGGPGNTGGFGFAGAGLDLSSREGLLRSRVLAPMPDGTPRLVAHLRAREAEVAGTRTEVLGMPLGLPPLPPEHIALVEAWVSQGAPP